MLPAKKSGSVRSSPMLKEKKVLSQNQQASSFENVDERKKRWTEGKPFLF